MDQQEIDRLMAGAQGAAPGAPKTPTPAPPLGELNAGPRQGAAAPLDTLLDVSLPVAIEFGRAQMTVQEVLELGAGSVIQLDRMVGEPIDIYVSDRKLAEGEVVVIGEHFGVRITRVIAGGEAGAAGS
ncbi:MAG TPA: flagellar motor switch protein FliN [Gemmatimonadales bacterium]|nr:flagellar motor switch protein FliN [Gemmatimonadales bacterium]